MWSIAYITPHSLNYVYIFILFYFCYKEANVFLFWYLKKLSLSLLCTKLYYKRVKIENILPKLVHNLLNLMQKMVMISSSKKYIHMHIIVG